MAWLDERPEYASLLVYENGNIKTTPGMQVYLRNSKW
jgi:hypothetical protein